eukprot:13995645-Ditylum_brightwellii.AAC.1
MGNFGTFVDPTYTVSEWLQSQSSVQQGLFCVACSVIMHQDQKLSTDSTLEISRSEERFYMHTHRPPINTGLKNLLRSTGTREIIDGSMKVLYVYKNSAPYL